jgi:hypothetical protein
MTLAYFMQTAGSDVFRRRDVLVVDETHGLGKWAEMYATIDLGPDTVPVWDETPPPDVTGLEAAAGYADRLEAVAGRRLTELRSRVELDADEVAERDRLVELQSDLSWFTEEYRDPDSPTTWVVDQPDGLGTRVTVKPMNPERYLHHTVWDRARKSALLSATILDKEAFCAGVGLPPDDVAGYLEVLPEPFAPSEYSASGTLDFLENNFASTQDGTVTVYAEGSLTRDSALESIQRANRDPPDSFVADGRRAETQSIITVIDDYAAQSPAFRRLVDRNDIDNDGVPDDDLKQVYDALLASPYRAQALNYITEDYTGTQVVYTVKADADQGEITADARDVADRYRLEATATGSTVVFQQISDTILASAIQSLLVALIATILFLLLVYYVLEGRASLGLVNLAPIIVAVALLAGSMRLFGIPFNSLTATILAIALGLGVDYSVHIVHRFTDEYALTGDVFAALDRTVIGTGGALTGSMLTTASGIGVLVLAVFPVLGQFGLLIALTVVYSYVTSLVVTPSMVVLWEALATRTETTTGTAVTSGDD